MATPPRILITNDDGIHAPGIRALFRAAAALGDPYVVAPRFEKSGVGHGITIADPLKVSRVEDPDGFHGTAVTGTPADCVKLAIKGLLDFVPDLVVSGINQGDNSATNILYSGTVAGALEGAMMGVPAIAFSLSSFRYTDYTLAEAVARVVIQRVLAEGLPEDTILNVNIPPVSREELKGFRITTQGKGRYEEVFEERINPQKRPYFWLGGRKLVLDTDENTDDLAVMNHYVSITPLQVDLTHHALRETLKGWNFKLD